MVFAVAQCSTVRRTPRVAEDLEFVMHPVNRCHSCLCSRAHIRPRCWRNTLKLKPSGALLGALLLTVAALAPAAPATAAEPKNLQVMSWNMCGSQRASWGCAGTGT